MLSPVIKTHNQTTERNYMKSMFPLTLAAVVGTMLIASPSARAADLPTKPY